MRTYSGLLILEDIFDYVPNTNINLYNLSKSVFTPNLPIVESDCFTTLGKFETVNYEAEGFVELATGLPLSRDRINQILSQGVYEVATRHLSTCISKNGVCQECYKATYPDQAIPNVEDRVIVLPEYLVSSEVVAAATGITLYTLNAVPEFYEKTFVFTQGVLLQSGVDYTISNNLLTLLDVPTENKSVVVHYIAEDRTPFVVWLANTYAGSLFGMKPLPAQKLPVRSLLLASLITENRLQLVGDELKTISTIPPLYMEYVDPIKDPLEKALYILALYSIYSNVTS